MSAAWEHRAAGATVADPATLLEALPHAVIVIDRDDRLIYANPAAETLFKASAATLSRRRFQALLSPHHPLVGLIEDVRRKGGSATEYGIDLSSPALGSHPNVDVAIRSLPSGPELLVSLIERGILGALERRQAQRAAARSMVALSSLLAHEIKNPLSGIRGAAQLLELEASADGRSLTRLICEETDRICALVDRMAAFGSARPQAMAPVNIHAVLSHVRQLAAAGFARHIPIIEAYDPSLPAVMGNRDELVQALLNLVKNAAEAIGEEPAGGRIVLGTRYRPGLRVSRGAGHAGLPLVVTVSDSGPGIPASVQAALFEPFVTTKARGSGLGLALVAKIVEDHGGLVEIERVRDMTHVRLLLPVAEAGADVAELGG